MCAASNVPLPWEGRADKYERCWNFTRCISSLSPEQAAPLWQAAQVQAAAFRPGPKCPLWGHTEPPFAFYSESFFGIRREGGGETPMQLLLEGGAGEAGSRSKEAKSNAISDESFAA